MFFQLEWLREVQARHRKNVQQDHGSRTNRIKILMYGPFLALLVTGLNLPALILSTPHPDIPKHFTKEADPDQSPF